LERGQSSTVVDSRSAPTSLLAQVRERVTDAGLDPTTVDEAIEAARKVS
jgi:hypothetical protein